MNSDSLERLIRIFLPISIFLETCTLTCLATVAITDYFILRREVTDGIATVLYLSPFLIVYAYSIFYGIRNFNYFDRNNLKHLMLMLIIPGVVGVSFGYSVHLKRKSFANGIKDTEPINEKSAIQIAEENFINKYGPEVLKQKPFQAELKNEVWFVSGTFHCPQGTGCKGGNAEIEISAKDGKVIKITHGK